uniref:Phosphatidylinositol transfer protein beta isoform n=1 Tax=Nothobranchius pienaari TaxID=704102 RepID=A0A1A8QS99_9TELE
MVLIKEYRVVLPVSVEEYQVGQLYSVAEASKNETGGGEGIEVLKNEPYEKEGEKGQYTHKIYHLNSKVPAFVRLLAPEGSLVFHEKAWNAYPYCRTIVTNEYMKDSFFIKIETWHKPDLGTQENVHKLDSSTWQNVAVVPIDIADRSQVSAADYKPDEDPAIFKSVKTGRGPLGPNWKKELVNKTECPRMCAYKLVTVKFEVWGLQTRVEQFVHKVVRDVLLLGHRQAFAWVDEWIDMTMDEVREFERTIQEATNQKIGVFPPSISISEMPLSSCALTGPASAPSTPMCTDAPESLSVPKDRPRKKSAPETLTLPDPAPSAASQGSSSNQLAMSNHLPPSTPPSNSDPDEVGGH